MRSIIFGWVSNCRSPRNEDVFESRVLVEKGFPPQNRGFLVDGCPHYVTVREELQGTPWPAGSCRVSRKTKKHRCQEPSPDYKSRVLRIAHEGAETCVANENA